MSAVTVDTLFAQLQAMHDSLQNGALDTVQELLEQHDRDVRGFMQAHGSRDTGADTLSNLLYAQLQLQDRLRDARDAAARKLRESQQAERATRAYLSTPGG
ncbi:hypothetical protein [Pseudoxanthomonas sp.]|jgi:hypothetical protein|uniref:hypothetical protein n=1 Tax=Pseudoxanthomonas sp. TaxID=1871049 RepID=UPI003F804EA0